MRADAAAVLMKPLVRTRLQLQPGHTHQQLPLERLPAALMVGMQQQQLQGLPRTHQQLLQERLPAALMAGMQKQQLHQQQGLARTHQQLPLERPPAALMLGMWQQQQL
jgi:hypothetical protein